jgi:ABC-type spermidine/putrescine transport system permease subunit I
MKMDEDGFDPDYVEASEDVGTDYMKTTITTFGPTLHRGMVSSSLK